MQPRLSASRFRVELDSGFRLPLLGLQLLFRHSQFNRIQTLVSWCANRYMNLATNIIAGESMVSHSTCKSRNSMRNRNTKHNTFFVGNLCSTPENKNGSKACHMFGVKKPG